MLFTILYLGLEPRIALERADSGELRLTKIVDLIKSSKYSIHDLSRSEAAKAGEPYRLNMPFELGVDYGCRLFGKPKQREKLTLILEGKPHASKVAISDLAGVDVECHHFEPYLIFHVVRNWLKSVCLPTAAGPAHIEAEFTTFMTETYEDLTAKGFSKSDIEALPVGELMEIMRRWLAA